MKILITGTTGFIGKNLQLRYQSLGHQVITYHRGESISQLLAQHNPHVIINCAAEIYDPEHMWATNTLLVQHILEWCRHNTSAKFIQLGSSSEYGPVARATHESDPIQARDFYAGTKGMATVMCQSYANAFGVDATVIRPYSPYGPYERAHRLFPRLWQSFNLNKHMDLVHGVHDFLYIDDFVDAVVSVVDLKQPVPGRVINIASGQQTTNTRVLEIFQHITGRPGNVTMQDKFVTPPVWCADITTAQVYLNWQPKISLEQGIKLFLEQGYYE